MSNILICVIAKNDLPENRRETVFSFVKDHGLFPFFLDYKEPFLEDYAEDNFIFSISDNDVFDNCEFFLLADNSFINGQTNYTCFRDRMEIFKSLTEKILLYAKKMEVFIGESGLAFEEFCHFDITTDELLPLLSRLNAVDPESMHIVISGCPI